MKFKDAALERATQAFQDAEDYLREVSLKVKIIIIIIIIRFAACSRVVLLFLLLLLFKIEWQWKGCDMVASARNQRVQEVSSSIQGWRCEIKFIIIRKEEKSTAKSIMESLTPLSLCLSFLLFSLLPVLTVPYINYSVTFSKEKAFLLLPFFLFCI